MILGIDYGAKLAGTTVIAQLVQHNQVVLHACAKGKDADAFILDFVKANELVWLVYLDAPLSLPMVYQKPKAYTDYFYRQADRECGAMSPMFLGGLTARAMKLSRDLQKEGAQTVETYPGQLAQLLDFKSKGYKKDKKNLPILCERFQEISQFQFDVNSVKDWHHFDALLCLYSAKRFEQQKAVVYGDEEEGRIIV